MDLEDIIGIEPLYEAMLRCKCGVTWKGSVASFYLNGLERIADLHRDLVSGRYKARPPMLFSITYPKVREIASIAFRDRVYQRSLNDNAIYPLMTKSFILDNYACQKGKGTDKARERLKTFLRKHYRQYGTEGWVAQFDVHGYYPTMPHDTAEQTFRDRLPADIYPMVETILREQYPQEQGYRAGSQLIQIAGVSILDRFDHYVKERLHAKLYLRYMDDFMIISSDREYLERCSEEIVRYLEGIGYFLNYKKTRIYKLEEGISFLGFTFRLTETGKVLMQVRPENVKAQRKKLRRLVARSKKGLIPREKVDESYSSWKAHAGKGNSFKLLSRMDLYYQSLWKGQENVCTD